MRRLLLILLPLGLAVSVTVSACSSDPVDDYCQAVQQHQSELSQVLGAGGPDAMIKALPIFRDLADRAPGDITDDWRAVIDPLTDLQRALHEAGTTAQEYDVKHPPAGVSAAERRAIAAAADRVASADATAAWEGVQQQARDVCQKPLAV